MSSAILFLILVVLAYVLRHLWRSWRHPANQLGRDAASRGWVYDGVRKESLIRNVRYRRNNWITEVSFKERKVYLIGNNGDEPKELWLSFDNYTQVDEFLSSIDEEDFSEDEIDQVIEQGRKSGIAQKANKYHDDIDNQVESLYEFFRENYSESRSEYSLKTLSVFATHISALISINRYFPDLHRVYINSLTSALASRTPNTQPKVEPEYNVFVSHCSKEESFMHEQTETFGRRGASPLIQELMQHLGAKEHDFQILLDRLDSTAEKAKTSYLPHLASM